MAVVERSNEYVWDVNTLTWVRGQQSLLSTDTLTVTIAGVSTAAKQDTGNTSLASIDTKLSRASSATTTLVNDNAANVTLLSLNTSRLGAAILNDSSATLYVKLGSVATTTDYTVSLTQNSYYEVPFGYTGRIDGIWASDPNNGAARITELT